ncbi:site-specific DNA-methyltransferase [Rothia mucilaginosa]|uniref:site-specific DNA-methyltransferase n=1 Tax=Rothia mucilaginosa TaxID=43675 RepID=UPI00066B812A|nr:site-specific DNA-methyltransferase [Rothia mucilaginosa]
MNEEDIQQVPPTTPNLHTDIARKLADLLPEVVADGKIDVAALQAVLGDDAATGTERFGLFWPGKTQAIRAAQTPTTATLAPDRENSLNWDATGNVVIEGDNLEVLKVLQKHYYGKIKMIYIDPPYNTGNDFVYSDDYADPIGTYLERTGQSDTEGKISTNTESDGRFHSNWLNMMYPRLKLARDLLREDGVLFVSIGERETARLRLVLDEIFGENNYVGDFVWRARTSISDDQEISHNHNYTLVYSRKRSQLTFIGDELNSDEYKNNDNDPRGPWKPVPLDANKPGGNTYYPVRNVETGEDFYPPEGRSWAINPEDMKALMEDNRIAFGKTGKGAPKRKLFLLERVSKGDSKTPSSLLLDVGTTRSGSDEIAALFKKKKVFSYPKPTSLLKKLIRYGSATDTNAIVLDFFAGSGTTAHAVMALNAEDGGNRRCISVQLPEPTDENSEARKAGYENIAEITRERIRRAGAKILEEESAKLDGRAESLDVGFRAYKLVDTNFTKWRADSSLSEEELKGLFAGMGESVDDDARPEALLTEVLLKLGFSLTEQVERVDVAGLEAFSVADGLVVAYLNEHVKPTLEQLRAMVAFEPGRLVVLEDAFQGDDVLKTNLVQECRSHGIDLWTA